MLFMQLAVASYACPGTVGSSSNAVKTIGSVDHPSMINCEGMDSAQPSLCHASSHAEVGKHSPDNAQLPDAPPFLASELVQVLRLSENGFDFQDNANAGTALARANAPPPITIRHCCFRI